MTKVVELCKIYKHLTLEDLQNEVWKDIEGYEGLYQISNMGRVKSMGRFAVAKLNSMLWRKERFLKFAIDKKGYRHLAICKDTILKTKRIHRLVAQHFVPNPENKPQVNHKKGIKSDNRATELEWVDGFENMRHAVIFGLRGCHKGEVNGAAKLKEHEVFEIRQMLLNGFHQWKIGEIYNVSQSTINSISIGKTWKHI